MQHFHWDLERRGYDWPWAALSLAPVSRSLAGWWLRLMIATYYCSPSTAKQYCLWVLLLLETQRFWWSSLQYQSTIYIGYLSAERNRAAGVEPFRIAWKYIRGNVRKIDTPVKASLLFRRDDRRSSKIVLAPLSLLMRRLQDTILYTRRNGNMPNCSTSTLLSCNRQCRSVGE